MQSCSRVSKGVAGASIPRFGQVARASFEPVCAYFFFLSFLSFFLSVVSSFPRFISSFPAFSSFLLRGPVPSFRSLLHQLWRRARPASFGSEYGVEQLCTYSPRLVAQAHLAGLEPLLDISTGVTSANLAGFATVYNTVRFLPRRRWVGALLLHEERGCFACLRLPPKSRIGSVVRSEVSPFLWGKAGLALDWLRPWAGCGGKGRLKRTMQ